MLTLIYVLINSLTGYAKMLYAELYLNEFGSKQYHAHCTTKEYPWRHQLVYRNADDSHPEWFCPSSNASNKLKIFDLSVKSMFNNIYYYICYCMMKFVNICMLPRCNSNKTTTKSINNQSTIHTKNCITSSTIIRV